MVLIILNDPSVVYTIPNMKCTSDFRSIMNVVDSFCLKKTCVKLHVDLIQQNYFLLLLFLSHNVRHESPYYEL